MPTRKLVIDLDVDADAEATLEAFERNVEAAFSPGYVFQVFGQSVTITAIEIVNEGPVEV